MAAPEATTCQYQRTYSTLLHLGAVHATRGIRRCAERSTCRVRLHLVTPGMSTSIVAETCGNHCIELEQLPEHDFSWPITF